MVLYNVVPSHATSDPARWINLDPMMPPLTVRPCTVADCSTAFDVCCGLGGFSTAMDFLNIRVLAAVDNCQLALDAYMCNHDAPSLCADIADATTVNWLHQKQLEAQTQPLMAIGFPCQPLSRQGRQLRQRDSRSKTLPAALRASFFLQSGGLVLECVPEAMTDTGTQTALHEYAQLRGFVIHQTVLHLQSMWPSRRSRWFALVVPPEYGDVRLPGLPSISPAPSVADFLMHGPWPVWAPEDESQLEWTDLECQVYRDPQYGSGSRLVDTSGPLPTALHSWGCALYRCPCGCRSGGLSPATLRAGGLRGVEIRAAAWPYKSRHIHPRELQLLLGFPPFEVILSDLRSQLCLYGNSVSPLQGIWALAHLLQGCGLLSEELTPVESLCQYVTMIIHQRDVTWPPPSVAGGTLDLDFAGTSTKVTFQFGATVGQLLRAELTLGSDFTDCALVCEGRTLPLWAYLQERSYQLDWVSVSDARGLLLDCDSQLRAPSHLVVQLDPDALELDLVLRFEGWGPSVGSGEGPLRVSAPQLISGLWGLDQLVRTNLLLSWVGSGYEPLTVWLPSFAEVQLELWPCIMDDMIRSWVSPIQVDLYAIVRESWGWHLVHFVFDDQEMQVTYFLPYGCSHDSASRLAHRVFGVSDRCDMLEDFLVPGDVSPVGSLGAVFSILDSAIGVPPEIRPVLAEARSVALDGSPSDDSVISPTVSMSVDDAQLPLPPGSPSSCGAGLCVGFALSFARTLARHAVGLAADHIRVLCQSSYGEALDVTCQDFLGGPAPQYLFLLANGHWSLVHCSLNGDTLEVVQYDGLARTTLGVLAPILVSVKRRWGATRVSVRSTWTIPQHGSWSCGTVAIGHFALLLDIITYEQAMHFETMHEGLAALSQSFSGPCGFGASEEAVVETLRQILPGKGVPEDRVRDRALAAIKALGAEAIVKASKARNPWAALKSLGNAKPRPFMWITHEELQEHISRRAREGFGAAVDIQKPRARKERKGPAPSAVQLLDPSQLALPPAMFQSNDQVALPQLTLQEVQKNARGVAFAGPADAAHFLNEGKFISTEALAVLVVGEVPDQAQTLPMHRVRVPAIYRGTQEPILVDCTSIQLGDQAVYKCASGSVPELTSFPTRVFRVHIFKDLWVLDFDWDSFQAKPIRALVDLFGILALCTDKACSGECGKFHPACEEIGVESAVLDIWNFFWHRHDGSKVSPGQADVLSVYIRVLESNAEPVHALSGSHGCFFEPRLTESPGPDPNFSVIWLPKCNLKEAIHKVRTHDQLVAVCRLGMKYGVRCLARHEKAMNQELRPDKPFVQCDIKQVFRLEPLPVGAQRQSIVDMLKALGWKARPLQPIRGTQGRAWQIGADGPPPKPFIEAKHGWCTITKIKDTVTTQEPSQLVATSKTRQHIIGKPGSSAADPWQGGDDPWAMFQGVTRPSAAAAVPSAHVQSKFEEVEQRIQDQVVTQVQATLDQHAKQVQSGDQAVQHRIQAAENQIQSLLENQQKMQNWMQDGSQRIAQVQHEQANMHGMIQQCNQQLGEQGRQLGEQGQALHSVAGELGKMQKNLQPSGCPGKVLGSVLLGFRRLFSLWTFLALTLSHFVRIGEAAVPGPPSDRFDSFVDPVPWDLEGSPDFCLGTCNPSGISNKHHAFELFPVGWWHVAETQATQSQQCGFQSFLRSVSYGSGRRLRSCLGAPAPLRVGSCTSGTWTGVLSFGDCPIRSVPGIWPHGEFASGRVVLSQAYVAGLQIGAATIYCPPKGPTYPHARELSERMLEAVTEQLVCGRQGPRIIAGDFNNAPGSLDVMKVWASYGFMELQSFMCSVFGVTPKPTCKGSTQPDQLWISPELLPFIVNSAVWSVFPDHSVVIAGLSLPGFRTYELQWPLPGRIPWDHVDLDSWHASPAGPSLVDLVSTSSPSDADLPTEVHTVGRSKSSAAFRKWSQTFESSVGAALVHPVVRHDSSVKGRGRLCRPVPRRVFAHVPKTSRPGELVQACGFLNRSTTNWFKQLRRLQSYGHSIRSPRAADNYLSRVALWRSILVAPGFVGGFSAWWKVRPFQSLEAPPEISPLAPSRDIFEVIYADFQVNYRRYEHWQLSRRQASSKAKLLSSQKRIFAPTRPEPKAPLEVVEDTVTMPITVVDAHRGLVSNIVQVLWPRALHGCAAVCVADSHIDKLRSGVMLALRWNRAGASPLVRVGLLHTEQLDPGWYQLWQCVMIFRRQWQSNPMVIDWWKLFVAGSHRKSTHGPFTKLLSQLHRLGLQIDDDARVWFSDQGSFSLIWDSETVVRRFLLDEYRNTLAGMVAARQGFGDLEGYDHVATEAGDSAYLPQDLELLHIVRDGTFHSDDGRSHYSADVSAVCPQCGVQATAQHKYEFCPKYQHVRARHQELFDKWADLPLVTRLHGLMPANPWRILALEALIRIPSRVNEAEFPALEGEHHVFTDGTCDHPTQPILALAAWAVVHANSGRVISSGPVQGLQQSSFRAELTAVWSALIWGGAKVTVLHIWCDNQDVVDTLRRLQQGTEKVSALLHNDLWSEIETLLLGASAQILIHKIPSHVTEEDCFSPMEDWTRHWNNVVDVQASVANHQRPRWFQRIWSEFVKVHQEQCGVSRLVKAFHLDVAKFDMSLAQRRNTPIDDEEVVVHFDRFINEGTLSAQFSRVFSGLHFERLDFFRRAPARLFQELVDWVILTDSEAPEMRLVSYMEMYVAFRVSRGSRGSLLSFASVEMDYSAVTFAADFRYFKDVLRTLLSWADISRDEGFVDLRSANIYVHLEAKRVQQRPERSAPLPIARGQSQGHGGRCQPRVD
eukprot:Skav206031  [mRNA]  locus=scaffold1314:405963:416245:+ [translate_table: standard]